MCCAICERIEQQGTENKKVTYCRNPNCNCHMENCITGKPHIYIPGDGDLGQAECKTCGLLKSTIEANKPEPMNDLEKILQQISVIMCGGEFKLPTNEYNELHELLSAALTSQREKLREKIIKMKLLEVGVSSEHLMWKQRYNAGLDEILKELN